MSVLNTDREADWLRTRKWDYWATGHFTLDMGEDCAAQHVRHFLRELDPLRNTVYSTPGQARSYAAWCVETGDLFGRTHAHLLIGGVGCHPALAPLMRRAWAWGRLELERYNPAEDIPGRPKSGACAYILKHPDALVIHGKMQKFRVRR